MIRAGKIENRPNNIVGNYQIMIIFSVPIIPEYLYTIRHQYDKTTTTTTRITTTTTTISTIPPGISKIRKKPQN